MSGLLHALPDHSEKPLDLCFVEVTQSHRMHCHPVPKVSDRSAVRQNRGLAVSLIQQMPNVPCPMSTQLAGAEPGMNVDLVRQKAAGHGGSPYGVECREKSTVYYARQPDR
jgi:hypothetical protein